MKFDYKKAKEQAAAAMKNPLLEAIILGPQGAGKSYALGTFGCKTLHLYGTRESHGPQAASVKGSKNLIPLCIDFGTWPGEEKERVFTADESMQMIESVLRDYEWLKSEKFGAVVFDGMAVLEQIVKETTEWKEKCKTSQGKHNTFKESEASIELIGRVIGFMKGCRRELGVHIVTTGIIDVKDTDQFGAVTEASPRLQGFGLAEMVNQNFGDVIVVGKLSKGGESKWKFQFMADISRTAKDEHGNQKRSMNLNPRLSGCEVPATIDADFATLAKYKAEGMK